MSSAGEEWETRWPAFRRRVCDRLLHRSVVVTLGRGEPRRDPHGKADETLQSWSCAGFRGLQRAWIHHRGGRLRQLYRSDKRHFRNCWFFPSGARGGPRDPCSVWSVSISGDMQKSWWKRSPVTLTASTSSAHQRSRALPQRQELELVQLWLFSRCQRPSLVASARTMPNNSRSSIELHRTDRASEY